jgi:hypothetical protein
MARASTWLEEGMLREPAACPERRVRPQLPSQLDPLETQLHLQLVCPKTTIKHHLWSSIMSASSWKHQHAQRYRVCKYASLDAQYHVLTKPTLEIPHHRGHFANPLNMKSTISNSRMSTNNVDYLQFCRRRASLSSRHIGEVLAMCSCSQMRKLLEFKWRSQLQSISMVRLLVCWPPYIFH